LEPETGWLADKILTSPEEELWYACAEKFEMIAPVKPSRPQEIISVHHAMLPFAAPPKARPASAD